MMFKRNEDMEQTMVISWAHWMEIGHPELSLLFHVPNGGSRNRIEAAKLKRMGVRAGVPDLCLPVARGMYNMLWIEMKYEDGQIRQNQKEFMRKAAANGAYCCVCYTADDAISVIQSYLKLCPIDMGKMENMMLTPNLCVLKGGKVKTF